MQITILMILALLPVPATVTMATQTIGGDIVILSSRGWSCVTLLGLDHSVGCELERNRTSRKGEQLRDWIPQAASKGVHNVKNSTSTRTRRDPKQRRSLTNIRSSQPSPSQLAVDESVGCKTDMHMCGKQHRQTCMLIYTVAKVKQNNHKQ